MCCRQTNNTEEYFYSPSSSHILISLTKASAKLSSVSSFLCAGVAALCTSAIVRVRLYSSPTLRGENVIVRRTKRIGVICIGTGNGGGGEYKGVSVDGFLRSPPNHLEAADLFVGDVLPDGIGEKLVTDEFLLSL